MKAGRISGCLAPLLAATACLEIAPPDSDRVPPVVLEVFPVGQEQVPTTVEISVRFSEPVLIGAADGLVILLASEELDAEILADLDKPPLSGKRAQLCVPCDTSIADDGQTVRLQPREPLLANTCYTVVVSAAVRDRAGNPLVDRQGLDEQGRPRGVNTHWLGEFCTSLGLVRISEILANPDGKEAAGEFVEVVNLTGHAVSLEGWRLDDSDGAAPGDRLGACPDEPAPLLAPGQVALLVGQSFVPGDGTAVTRYCTNHSTLTSRGLRNSAGEVLVLSDDEGREQDRYGGWYEATEHEGCGLQRLDPAASDAPDNWYWPQLQPCATPGWIPESPGSP